MLVVPDGSARRSAEELARELSRFPQTCLREDRLSLLGDKAGPILFQLPPNLSANAGRLSDFIKLLSNVWILPVRNFYRLETKKTGHAAESAGF